jgi:hypothetical protein
MQYPIFQSVTHKIKSSLDKSGIDLETFKLWEETQINATGLEIAIDLSQSTDHLRAVSINFDWDRFRETQIAKQLEGTEEHPLLKSPHLLNSDVDPVMDIEVVWYFDEERCQSVDPPQDQNENYRIDHASQWMSDISHKVNDLLKEDDIITRWHIEIEGDEKGKCLTAINLISYFQYQLSDLDSLTGVHQYIEQKVRDLLSKINRVIRLSDQAIKLSAA